MVQQGSLLDFLTCLTAILLLFIIVSISKGHLLSHVLLNTLYRNANEDALERIK